MPIPESAAGFHGDDLGAAAATVGLRARTLWIGVGLVAAGVAGLSSLSASCASSDSTSGRRRPPPPRPARSQPRPSPPPGSRARPRPRSSSAGSPQKLNVLGNPKAPVTMIEFADLAVPLLPRLHRGSAAGARRPVRPAPGKVKVVFSGMALRRARFGEGAARGLRRRAPGELWQYLDLLYRNQGAENAGWVTDELLRSVGDSLPGFDTDKMLADMTSPEVTDALAAADQQAHEREVNSDPDVLRRADRRDAPAHRRDLADAGRVSAPRSTRCVNERRQAARRDRGARACGRGRRRLPRLRAVHRTRSSPARPAAARPSSTRSTRRRPGSRLPCSGSSRTSRSLRRRCRPRVEAAAIGAAIVLAGLVFGVYLIVIQVAVIDAICQWCLASDAILALLAVATAPSGCAALRGDRCPRSDLADQRVDERGEALGEFLVRAAARPPRAGRGPAGRRLASTTRAPAVRRIFFSSACAQTPPNEPLLAPITATGLPSSRPRRAGARPSRSRSSAGRGPRVVLRCRDQHASARAIASRSSLPPGSPSLAVVVLVVRRHGLQAAEELELGAGRQSSAASSRSLRLCESRRRLPLIPRIAIVTPSPARGRR